MGWLSVTCLKCGSDVTRKKLENDKSKRGFAGEIKIENTNCEFKCHKCGYK